MATAQELAQALAPKSDQLNADDLITCNKVIVITGVKIDLGSEQKTIINYEGDNGKPWKPSKGMGRVLAEILGGDPSLWAGNSVELYRDKSVSFGKEKNCGGIRICGMSAVKTRTTMLITSSKGKKSSITIEPIAVQQAQQLASAPSPSRLWAEKLAAATQYGSAIVDEIWLQVPQELKNEKLVNFYNDKFKEARGIDIQNEPNS